MAVPIRARQSVLYCSTCPLCKATRAALLPVQGRVIRVCVHRSCAALRGVHAARQLLQGSSGRCSPRCQSRKAACTAHTATASPKRGHLLHLHHLTTSQPRWQATPLQDARFYCTGDTGRGQRVGGGSRRQPHQPLAGLPQLPGHGVVAGMGPRLLQAAVGEVAAAEALEALLRGAEQRGLGALGGVAEEEPGQGHEERLQPEREVAEQLRVDEAWGEGKGRCRSRGLVGKGPPPPGCCLVRVLPAPEFGPALQSCSAVHGALCKKDALCRECTVQRDASCKGMHCAKGELCRGMLHAKGRCTQRDAKGHTMQGDGPCKACTAPRMFHGKDALCKKGMMQRVQRAKGPCVKGELC